MYLEHFLPAFFRLLKGISMPHPTSKFENYYFNIFLEEAAPHSPPSMDMLLLNGPLWNCSAELHFGMICKLILVNN